MKLRAEVDLQDVKSISCTCVCRVISENEEEYIAANQPDRSNISSIFAIPDDPDEGDDYDDSDYNGFDRDPGPASLNVAMDSVAFYPGMSRMMVTPSGDHLCIKTDGGVTIDNDNEDDNILRPPRGTCRNRDNENGSGEIQMQHQFDPYTQLWLCGRDQKKGLLQIFTYNDNNVGQYVST